MARVTGPHPIKELPGYWLVTVDNVRLVIPDLHSLWKLVKALKILRQSPLDYLEVNRLRLTIFITQCKSRGFSGIILKEKKLPAWFIDRPFLFRCSDIYLASCIVHDTQHAFQFEQFGTPILKMPEFMEKDACREQNRFLSVLYKKNGSMEQKRFLSLLDKSAGIDWINLMFKSGYWKNLRGNPDYCESEGNWHKMFEALDKEKLV